MSTNPVAVTTDSTRTQHATNQPVSPAPPMRQVSLEVLRSTEVKLQSNISMHQKPNIFNDVLEQLAIKEDALPIEAGIFTLPSMQFLETLLDDIDSQNATNGKVADPPLLLPLDAFDLPGDDVSFQNDKLKPTPFELMMDQSKASYTVNAFALSREAKAPAAPTTFIPTLEEASSQHLTCTHSADSLHHAGSSYMRNSGVCKASPRMQHPGHMRRVHSAQERCSYKSEANPYASKAGRVRKASSFTAAKRKSMGEMSWSFPVHHYPSAPAAFAQTGAMVVPCSSQSTGLSDGPDDSSEEVSRGSQKRRGKGKKGKRTTCLNCGCHQTPQWRCGPLGPRTLCNACGVRYKKGLPLTCWPLRDGMILPQGAVLPAGIHIPPGINIIMQPSVSE